MRSADDKPTVIAPALGRVKEVAHCLSSRIRAFYFCFTALETRRPRRGLRPAQPEGGVFWTRQKKSLVHKSGDRVLLPLRAEKHAPPRSIEDIPSTNPSRLILALGHKQSLRKSMSQAAIIRTRIDPRRKAKAEAIMAKLGVSPDQAINMFYAQIELRKAIPFTLSLGHDRTVAVPIEHTAQVWDQLDQEDYSHLAKP
jgi:DNA-damage-inducible protein J